MATVPAPLRMVGNGYPTSDGKPMAETDVHREQMVAAIAALKAFFAGDPTTYVSGNLLMFYQRGNRRRHVSPDVFVAFGVGNHLRPNYLVWEEAPPRVVFELTSSSTRHADVRRKFELYRDVLKVREYFLFDPNGDYLDPSMQGWRLRGDEYVAIRPLRGRLPSRELGLHLERDGHHLRLWDPATEGWLLTPAEEVEAARAGEEAARAAAEQRAAENARLRRLLEQAGVPLPDDLA